MIRDGARKRPRQRDLFEQVVTVTTSHLGKFPTSQLLTVSTSEFPKVKRRRPPRPEPGDWRSIFGLCPVDDAAWQRHLADEVAR